MYNIVVQEHAKNVYDLLTSHFCISLAALEHVNNRDGSVVPGLASLTCPVQLNYTLLDSMLQFPNTLQQYFKYKEVVGKAPDGIIGPGRTSTTIPLSFVSTVDEVPLVGYAATGQGNAEL